MLSEESVRKYLLNNVTVFLYDEIDSTNTKAKQMLRDGLSSNTLFIAKSQSGGRGRQGKSFYSPKDTGLYMSVALCGDTCPDSLFITSSAAVIVAQAIEELCSAEVKIKWVNDLYINNKKICGILTEAVRDAQGSLIGIVVGVGINITTDTFPDDIKNIAASVGENIDKNRLSAIITNKLISADFNDESILKEYKNRSIVIGNNITYYINNIPHQGRAIDIDNNGGLVVETMGKITVLNSGEITLRIN